MAQEVPLESYDEHDDERNMLIVEGEEDQTDPLERGKRDNLDPHACLGLVSKL